MKEMTKKAELAMKMIGERGNSEAIYGKKYTSVRFRNLGLDVTWHNRNNSRKICKMGIRARKNDISIHCFGGIENIENKNGSREKGNEFWREHKYKQETTIWM